MSAFRVWKQVNPDPAQHSEGWMYARRYPSALGIALSMALVVLTGYFQPVSAEETPDSFLQVTPTPDRLAEPTLPVVPSQADLGAQLYWLHCMACHGDRGQGLTDEFRTLYPPEDQNCWESGCHGARPYEEGWTLPDKVPPVNDPGLLEKYGSAEGLFSFVRSAMPWQARGSLGDESYARIVAFLLREQGADADRLDGSLSPDSDSADLELGKEAIRESLESALGHSEAGALANSDLTLVVLVILSLSMLVAIFETVFREKRN